METETAQLNQRVETTATILRRARGGLSLRNFVIKWDGLIDYNDWARVERGEYGFLNDKMLTIASLYTKPHKSVDELWAMALQTPVTPGIVTASSSSDYEEVIIAVNKLPNVEKLRLIQFLSTELIREIV